MLATSDYPAAASLLMSWSWIAASKSLLVHLHITQLVRFVFLEKLEQWFAAVGHEGVLWCSPEARVWLESSNDFISAVPTVDKLICGEMFVEAAHVAYRQVHCTSCSCSSL
jgi:hypothetical protein